MARERVIVVVIVVVVAVVVVVVVIFSSFCVATIERGFCLWLASVQGTQNQSASGLPRSNAFKEKRWTFVLILQQQQQQQQINCSCSCWDSQTKVIFSLEGWRFRKNEQEIENSSVSITNGKQVISISNYFLNTINHFFPTSLPTRFPSVRPFLPSFTYQLVFMTGAR